MAEKAKKNNSLNKKNLFYILWLIALVAVMATAIVIVASVTDNKTNVLDKGSGTQNELSSTGDSTSLPNSSTHPEVPENPGNGNEEGKLPTEPDEPNEPVIGKIVFAMPCEGATIIKAYTDNTLVFNSTLGAYMGHMGIDFSAEEGAEVVCVYDGVIESITTSYLTGTTVTIDHGNNLKTVYNSIDANEALYEGATVTKGSVIGYVSANNLQEYKDGPHLHFEVIKSGDKINPEEYLIGEEK